MLFQVYGENALYQWIGWAVVFVGLILINEIARSTKVGGVCCFIVLPIVLPMLVPALTGLDALYFAVPIADGLSVVTAAAFLAFEMRRLKRVEAGEEMSRFGKGAKHS